MTTDNGADTQQFAEFRKELARLRGLAGLSQSKVGEALAEHGGDRVSGSAVGEWERGPSIPGRRNVAALERLLDVPGGTLAAMVGYDTGHRYNDERMDAIEDQLRSMKSSIDELADLVRSNLSRRR